MLTVDFIYLISFVMFAYFAFKLGQKHLKPVCDEGIDNISKTIEIATSDMEKALAELNAMKTRLKDFEQSLEKIHEKTNEKANFLLQKHQEWMNQQTQLHEQKIYDGIAHERITQLREIKAEVLNAVSVEVLHLARQDKNFAHAYNKRSFKLLDGELS